MAGIGGVTCTFVKGALPRGMAQRVETWHTPGLSGQAGLKLGFSDGDFSVRAILYGAVDDVVTWKLALEALQGEVVSIADDYGVTSEGCLITRVGECQRTPVTGTGVAGTDCRGEIVVEGVRVYD